MRSVLAVLLLHTTHFPTSLAYLNATIRSNTINFNQAVSQIANGNTASQQAGGNPQSSSNRQWSPDPPTAAVAVCTLNQGWPSRPGSCNGGTHPPLPSSIARPPNCPWGTISCAMTGHPGFCCQNSDWCCIDQMQQAACCPIGSCCTGALTYGLSGPPGGQLAVSGTSNNGPNNAGNYNGGQNPTINISKARRLEISSVGVVWAILSCIFGIVEWKTLIGS